MNYYIYWFYFLVIIYENQEITLSEPFTLIRYIQLMKRKVKIISSKSRSIYDK